MNNSFLHSTFCHIGGITEKKEKKYWSEGITTLATILKCDSGQLSLFDDTFADKVNASIKAIASGDIAPFLSGNLPEREYYRIAYTYPEGTMFLDIETTGLSKQYHYITLIGWIINGRFKCWLPGEDTSEFLSDFNSSKLIVTFNGKRFDCRFLEAFFHTDIFTKKPNIDLLYLTRYYISNPIRKHNDSSLKKCKEKFGQKELEKIVGFERPKSVTDTDGKEAIALWYRFLWGDNEAMRTLLVYNFYDLLGMECLLDYVLTLILESNNTLCKCTFRRFYTPSRIPSSKKQISNALKVSEQIRAYVNKTYRSLTISEFSDSRKYRIVGIDLAGKDNRDTGFCVLTNDRAETQVLHTVDEIINNVIKAEPNLVSIDAPLTLPEGRITVANDDPNRDCGITRYCERVLSRRGMHAYPALINSMQPLTARGIEIAKILRQKGIPVIESFPGAAQDVLQLPRKRADKNMLKTGLIRFGVQGEYETADVVHDELDAITSAIVGRAYLSGYCEAIGNEAEDYLIIPSLSKSTADRRLIIGLCGFTSAGKTTFAKHIEQKGFYYVRYSQILQECSYDEYILGSDPGKSELQKIGYDIFTQKGQYWLNKAVLRKVGDAQLVVIDGMRHPEDFTFWKEKYFSRFVLINVEASYETRATRFSIRNSSTSYSDIIGKPVEQNIPKLMALADYNINNDNSLKVGFHNLDLVIDDLLGGIVCL